MGIKAVAKMKITVRKIPYSRRDHTNLSHSRNTEEVSLLVNENDDDLFDGMNLSIDDIPSNQLVSSLNLQQVRITH